MIDTENEDEIFVNISHSSGIEIGEPLTTIHFKGLQRKSFYDAKKGTKTTWLELDEEASSWKKTDKPFDDFIDGFWAVENIGDPDNHRMCIVIVEGQGAELIEHYDQEARQTVGRYPLIVETENGAYPNVKLIFKGVDNDNREATVKLAEPTKTNNGHYRRENYGYDAMQILTEVSGIDYNVLSKFAKDKGDQEAVNSISNNIEGRKFVLFGRAGGQMNDGRVLDRAWFSLKSYGTIQETNLS